MMQQRKAQALVDGDDLLDIPEKMEVGMLPTAALREVQSAAPWILTKVEKEIAYRLALMARAVA
eukprot:3438887-Karenia_brevis.AAC.1